MKRLLRNLTGTYKLSKCEYESTFGHRATNSDGEIDIYELALLIMEMTDCSHLAHKEEIESEMWFY